MLKYIECHGNPRSLGLQYGEQAKAEIRRYQALRGWERLSEESLNTAAQIRRGIDKYLPSILEELKGIADGAGVDLNMILLANHVNTSADGCTPVLLRNPPEGTIIAKNNDSPPGEDYPFVIRKCEPDKGLPFIQLTYAGWLSGLDAMNAEGLANTHGSVGSVFDKSGMRIDIRLKTYQLMRSCRTTDEFIAGLNETPLTGKGFSIAVGDIQGNTAMLDAALPFVAVRDREKNFAYSTNLYMAPGFEGADLRPAEQRPICFLRNGYLRWIEEERPPRNLADIKTLLSSHEPWAPCRHGGPHRSETVWSMINLPRERKILVADGNPCKNQYKEFKL